MGYFTRNLKPTPFRQSCRQTRAKSCFLQLTFDPIFMLCITHIGILALTSPSRTLIGCYSATEPPLPSCCSISLVVCCYNAHNSVCPLASYWDSSTCTNSQNLPPPHKDSSPYPQRHCLLSVSTDAVLQAHLGVAD